MLVAARLAAIELQVDGVGTQTHFPPSCIRNASLLARACFVLGEEFKDFGGTFDFSTGTERVGGDGKALGCLFYVGFIPTVGTTLWTFGMVAPRSIVNPHA